MANLTVTIDEDLLRRARIRALEQGTSVNAVVRDLLGAYAGRDETASAAERIVELSRGAIARSGGRTWSRDELHER